MSKFIYKALILIVIIIASYGLSAFINRQLVVAEAPANIPCSLFNEIEDFAKCEVEKRWGSSQWESFHAIIQKESGWNHLAINKSSGACGLVQSLPCSKLGDNWEDPRHQIMWGIDYIENRYGTPHEALDFHRLHNWY